MIHLHWSGEGHLFMTGLISFVSDNSSAARCLPSVLPSSVLCETHIKPETLVALSEVR